MGPMRFQSSFRYARPSNAWDEDGPPAAPNPACCSITSLEESHRIKRSYPIDFPFGLMRRAFPKSTSQQIHRLTGAVLMQSVARPLESQFFAPDQGNAR